jgi:hypothetical protein
MSGRNVKCILDFSSLNATLPNVNIPAESAFERAPEVSAGQHGKIAKL